MTSSLSLRSQIHQMKNKRKKIMGKHAKQKPIYTLDELDEMTLKSSINSERITAQQIRELLTERWGMLLSMVESSSSQEVRKILIPYADGFKAALSVLDEFIDDREESYWEDSTEKTEWDW
jgi:fumarylacetoacetate (FAA) hydrolase family protein